MVTLWPIIRGGRARSTKHELRAEILPGPRQQGLCYAVTSGFYPVNCELPDCGLLNGKGLGDDKSSPIKKKKIYAEKVWHILYLYPYLEEPQRHSQKRPQNAMCWTVAPPYLYVEALQNAIVWGRPKSSLRFFYHVLWEKMNELFGQPNV